MRIAVMLRHVAQGGGVGTYSREIVDALLRADHQNHYLLLLADAADAARFAHHPAAEPIVLGRAPALAWDQLLVPLALRRHRADIVLNPKHGVPLLTGARRILVLHGADWLVFPENYPPLDRLYHRLALPLYVRAADRIVSVSADAARRIEARLPRARGRLTTIHHGVDAAFRPDHPPARLAEIRARYRLPARFLLFVGQIYPMKNLAGLLRAYALIAGEPEAPDLVLAGKPALRWEADLALIDELGLGARVHRPGWVADDDLPALYAMAEMLVMPSLYEGFGIPLLEAMASGCPIVTSTAGSCPEVVGDAALLADPRDPAAIAGAIRQLLGDGDLRRELCRRGLDRVPGFGWDRAAAALLALIGELGKERRSG